MRIPHFAVPICATLLLLSLGAGGTPHERPGERPRDSRFLTAEEIAASGAQDAWEAIRFTSGRRGVTR